MRATKEEADRRASAAAAASLIIERAHRCGREVGLRGQAPSDHPEFARFLVEAGVDSLSVTPDSFAGVKQPVAEAEAARAAQAPHSRAPTQAPAASPASV